MSGWPCGLLRKEGARVAKKSAKFRIEKVFWAAQMPIVLVLVLFFRNIWDAVSIGYIAELSVYALVKGSGGQEQAAEAKEATQDA
jgi:hypothetical protein